MANPEITVMAYLRLLFREATESFKAFVHPRPIIYFIFPLAVIFIVDLIAFPIEGRKVTSEIINRLLYSFGVTVALGIGFYILYLMKSPFTIYRKQLRTIATLTEEKSSWKIAEGLLPLYTRGQVLLLQSVQPDIIGDFDLHDKCSRWIHETKAYIAEHLGTSQAALFDGLYTGDRTFPTAPNEVRQEVLTGTHVRVERLEAIIKELSQ